jgi:asparagine synthetase B (glutamine-hydrolysing)
MCSITGIISKNKIKDIELRINSMNKSIEHMDSDNQSIKNSNKNIAFGHCRLKIIDLNNSANQTFCSKD